MACDNIVLGRSVTEGQTRKAEREREREREREGGAGERGITVSTN